MMDVLATTSEHDPHRREGDEVWRFPVWDPERVHTKTKWFCGVATQPLNTKCPPRPLERIPELWTFFPDRKPPTGRFGDDAAMLRI